MKKTFICCVLLIVTSLVSSLYSQEEDKTKIKNKINSIRKNLNLDDLIFDDVLSQASEMLEFKELNSLKSLDAQDSKDIITFLRNNHIFDYHIKSIILESNTIDEIDFKKNEQLYDVLKNKNINKANFTLLKEENKVKLRLILTENYIVFSKEFHGEAYINDDAPPTEYITIKGKSNIDNLYYETYKSKELNEKDKLKSKSKINLNSNKEFEIRFNVSDDLKERAYSIAFVNKNGDILAFLPF